MCGFGMAAATPSADNLFPAIPQHVPVRLFILHPRYTASSIKHSLILCDGIRKYASCISIAPPRSSRVRPSKSKQIIMHEITRQGLFCAGYRIDIRRATRRGYRGCAESKDGPDRTSISPSSQRSGSAQGVTAKQKAPVGAF